MGVAVPLRVVPSPTGLPSKLFLYTFTYGFIFGCAGSLSLPGLFSSAGERGYSLVVAHSVPTAWKTLSVFLGPALSLIQQESLDVLS